MSYTQIVHNELNAYLKANKKEKGELFPIIYVSPEFFEGLYAEKSPELDTKLGKYAMTFEKYSIVIKKKYTGTKTQIHIV